MCFVGESGETLPHAIGDGQRGVEELCGRNRCLGADLVVVEDLRRLRESPDSLSLHHVLAISGRGLPVIIGSSWILAGGKIDMVPKESVLRHVALVDKKEGGVRVR